MSRSLAAALLASLLPFAAPAQQPALRVQVLMVESLPDFERWAQSSPSRAYSRGLGEAPVGKPVHFPILVGVIKPPSGDINLVADIEFFAPNGASLGALKQCCRFTAPAGTDVPMAVLSNAATLTFGANDVRGTYSVAVSVTNGTDTVTTRESIRFPGPPVQEMPSAAAEAPKLRAEPPKSRPEPARPRAETPKLRMNTPEKNPGQDADKRDCLSLSTPAEIIKCAEKKK
ncbi:MAG TPA: hypothetical protein VM122_08400 [Usitatibacter sp.]|nr:hypothetical protein [Usitatibacter sp.]